MKHAILTTIAASIFALCAHARSIEQLALDPDNPVTVAIGPKTATTLQFPRAVEGIFGYGLTSGDAPGTYQYDHPSGSSLITLRNLMPDKETFLTVLLGGDELYVLHLKPSANPPVAVRFLDPGFEAAQFLAKPIDAETAEARKLDGGTDRLFNLLKLGKNERVFRAALPHLYQDAESRKVSFVHDDGEALTEVTTVHRFPSEDAVFLSGHIENKTGEAMHYDPGGLEVQVGKRTYPAALVDAANIVPAGGKAPFHVLLRGGVEGERAHLSIKNEFRVVLPIYTEGTDDPALTDALGLVIGPPGEPRIDASLFGETAPRAVAVTQPDLKGSK